MFKIRSSKFEAALLAACLLAAAPMAKAGPDEAALLQAVKVLAAQGQNAQTTAQVNAYVDQNQDAIAAILKGYAAYLQQLQAAGGDDGSGVVPAALPAAPPASTGTSENPAGGAPEASAPPSSTALKITGVQPSGGLQTSHLAGYPALPDAEPVSTVTQPTAAQLQYAAKTQLEMQVRKAYLMAHPEGYTY